MFTFKLQAVEKKSETLSFFRITVSDKKKSSNFVLRIQHIYRPAAK